MDTGSENGQPEHYTKLRTIIISGVSLLLVVFILLSIWQAYGGYRVAISNAEDLSRSYAHSLKEHAERAISEADHTLDATIKQIEAAGGTSSMDRERLTGILKSYTRNIPQISAITVINSTGMVQATTLDHVTTLPDASKRAYFIHHRENSDKQIHISPPVQSLVTKQWGFILSRRLETVDGHFDGVALVFFDI